MTAPQDPFSQPAPGSPPAPGYGPPPAYDGQGAAPGYGQAPGYGGYAQAPGYGGYTQAPRTDTKAIVALVCAIGSFVVFPLIPAIVALVLAGQSRRQIAASGGALTGDGLNTASKVVAWINIGLSLLALVAVIGLLAVGFSSVGGVDTSVGY